MAKRKMGSQSRIGNAIGRAYGKAKSAARNRTSVGTEGVAGMRARMARKKARGAKLMKAKRAVGKVKFQFTSARRAALAKARRASAQARKGKNRATNTVSSAIARARTAMGRTSRRGSGRTGGGIR
jgi:hypothetical protein